MQVSIERMRKRVARGIIGQHFGAVSPVPRTIWWLRIEPRANLLADITPQSYWDERRKNEADKDCRLQGGIGGEIGVSSGCTCHAISTAD